MEQNSDKSHSNDHHQAPSDEVTRNKIDKHLSDINDKISEQDIKNINTNTGNDAAAAGANAHDRAEADEILKEKRSDDDEPEKESPTAWEILGE